MSDKESRVDRLLSASVDALRATSTSMMGFALGFAISVVIDPDHYSAEARRILAAAYVAVVAVMLIAATISYWRRPKPDLHEMRIQVAAAKITALEAMMVARAALGFKEALPDGAQRMLEQLCEVMDVPVPEDHQRTEASDDDTP